MTNKNKEPNRGESGGAVAGAIGGNVVGEALRREDHVAVRLDEGLLQELELVRTVL
jgi:outer membrane lipoprotein SlyB